MIVLGWVKGGGFGDFRDDRVVELRSGFGFRFGRGDLLILAVKVDGGAVLSASVGPLTIEGRGVVKLPENFENFGEGDFVGIELDLGDFGVPRAA